jgi:hypothetical protein
MPAKVLTFCYVHDISERVAREYTVKDIAAIVKLSDTDATKIVFLRIKAFIPIDTSKESKIDSFKIGDAIFLKGKFVPFENYYIVRPLSQTQKNSLTNSHLL